MVVIHRYNHTVYLKEMTIYKYDFDCHAGSRSVLFHSQFFLTLPWTIWDRVTKIIRSTISLNGYTAMEPDGVLEEKEDHKEDGDEAEEEGESKEEH